MRPLTRDQVRDIDRRAIADYGMSGLVLMENAGRGCVDVLQRLGCTGPVTILCGKGNNAGDGFVIARHLDLRGIAVKVLLFAPARDLTGDAAANYAIVARAQLPICDLSASPTQLAIERELEGSQWLIDSLLGTGAVGAPRPPFDAAIHAMNESSAWRMAIDLPSGLDCDTGEPSEPTVRAHHTCTFVAPKVGFTNPAAGPYLGHVHVLDIGAPSCLVTG